MVDITASMVKQLRERTDLGMMECKKALTETNGDMDAAENLLRIKSGAKAGKAASRIAAEGLIACYINPAESIGALIEVNCETDFVAKNDDFVFFTKKLAELIVLNNPVDAEALLAISAAGESIEDRRKALIMKLGENINIRRFVRFETQRKLASYIHGTRIGVMMEYEGEESLGKDVAMHIAASKPVCVSADEVPGHLIEREREIYSAQAAETGKPADIITRMVEGRIAKYLAEVTLLGQPFVKNPDMSIEKLLLSKKAKIYRFAMYTVGEGIEKKVTDFAAEVAAQVGQAG
ncbi:MAG: elongation factor Ts [Proteobacteria bacterium]|nr:elongation factor Ts [Pseudomonadota bacterium]MDE3209016.1 elongation factor Ts [Pseudomonadota bacterium]